VPTAPGAGRFPAAVPCQEAAAATARRRATAASDAQKALGLSSQADNPCENEYVIICLRLIFPKINVGIWPPKKILDCVKSTQSWGARTGWEGRAAQVGGPAAHPTPAGDGAMRCWAALSNMVLPRPPDSTHSPAGTHPGNSPSLPLRLFPTTSPSFPPHLGSKGGRVWDQRQGQRLQFPTSH